MCAAWLSMNFDTQIHSYVLHDSAVCGMTHSYVWHDSFVCDVTLSYARHDSFIRVKELFSCDTTRTYGENVGQWHDFDCVCGICYTCRVWGIMSHISMSHESSDTYQWVMSPVCLWMSRAASHVTYTNKSCHTYQWIMSYIRLLSHVPYLFAESCPMYICCTSHVLRHVTYTNVHVAYMITS